MSGSLCRKKYSGRKISVGAFSGGLSSKGAMRSMNVHDLISNPCEIGLPAVTTSAGRTKASTAREPALSSALNGKEKVRPEALEAPSFDLELIREDELSRESYDAFDDIRSKDVGDSTCIASTKVGSLGWSIDCSSETWNCR